MLDRLLNGALHI